MTEGPVCPPSHQPISEDEIAWVVVTLHRGGMGVVEARAVHLRNEDEAHEVATLLSRSGPTWMLGVGFDEVDLERRRYGAPTDD